MATEQKRMFQRRGLKADLPQTPENGEIYLTIDTEEMFIGVNGNYLKLTTFKDVVDNALTDSSTLPLSARQGLILQGKISSLENFIEMYKTQIDKVLSNHVSQTQQNTSDIELLKKDIDELENNTVTEIPITSSNTAPNNTEIMWFDTNGL